MCQECWGCTKRTVEPNCHNEATCEHWATHVEKQKAKYARRKETVINSKLRGGYIKSKDTYIPGTQSRVI